MALSGIHGEFVMLAPPEPAMRSWLGSYGLAMGQVGGYSLASQAGDTATYHRKWTSIPILLCCILLFPIGLLALLARRDLNVIVRFSPYGDQDTLVTWDGVVPGKFGEEMEEAARDFNEKATAEYARRAQESGNPPPG